MRMIVSRQCMGGTDTVSMHATWVVEGRIQIRVGPDLMFLPESRNTDCLWGRGTPMRTIVNTPSLPSFVGVARAARLDRARQRKMGYQFKSA